MELLVKIEVNRCRLLDLHTSYWSLQGHLWNKVFGGRYLLETRRNRTVTIWEGSPILLWKKKSFFWRWLKKWDQKTGNVSTFLNTKEHTDYSNEGYVSFSFKVLMGYERSMKYSVSVVWVSYRDTKFYTMSSPVIPYLDFDPLITKQNNFRTKNRWCNTC